MSTFEKIFADGIYSSSIAEIGKRFDAAVAARSDRRRGTPTLTNRTVLTPTERAFTPHPTRYKGHLMRSRLEANWAAAFDLLGWPWSYEPLELAGYIPDFILHFYQPLLVEVKPCWTLDEMHAHTGKIARSGWTGSALIVGVVPLDDAAGLLYQPGVGWDIGMFSFCTHCGHHSLYHQSGCWTCVRAGCYDGAHYLGPPDDIAALWAQAHEMTRWLPGQ